MTNIKQSFWKLRTSLTDTYQHIITIHVPFMKVPLLLFHVVQFCCDVSVKKVVTTIIGGITYKVTQNQITIFKDFGWVLYIE